MLHAVIMAGGGGTRLWPLSTPARPKQYLNLTGASTMLALTVQRLEGLVPPAQRWIVTTADQAEHVKALSLNLPDENVICEPVGRNTAPCIGLAAVRVRSKEPDATMLVLPADHLITDISRFHSCVKTASDFVANEPSIVTFGVVPTRPETGYGYIHAGSDQIRPDVHPVVAFKEKPTLDRAQEFLEAGHYFWNSGMFVWKADYILNQMELFLPQHHSILADISSLESDDPHADLLYESMSPISIDYGVLEQSDKVRMVRADFAWSDVGGYEELHRISEKNDAGNSSQGHVYLEKTTNSYIVSNDSRPLAVIGLDSVAVIANEDGILVSSLKDSQAVKKVSDWVHALK